MNLYCSYLGPFVELKEPKIIKKILAKDAPVCRNKGCSTFGQFKQTGNYCSTCGTKQPKENIVLENTPTIESLKSENRGMLNFNIVNTINIHSKKYFLTLSDGCYEKYSGKYYQTNQSFIIDGGLIENQKNKFDSQFETVKETINNNFGWISEIQYGWIKFESEDEDCTNCNC